MNKDEHRQFDEFERQKIRDQAREELQKEIDARMDAALDETLRELGVASLAPSSNGRWEELTVEDFKFLHSCGIPVNFD